MKSPHSIGKHVLTDHPELPHLLALGLPEGIINAELHIGLYTNNLFKRVIENHPKQVILRNWQAKNLWILQIGSCHRQIDLPTIHCTINFSPFGSHLFWLQPENHSSRFKRQKLQLWFRVQKSSFKRRKQQSYRYNGQAHLYKRLIGSSRQLYLRLGHHEKTHSNQLWENSHESEKRTTKCSRQTSSILQKSGHILDPVADMPTKLINILSNHVESTKNHSIQLPSPTIQAPLGSPRCRLRSLWPQRHPEAPPGYSGSPGGTESSTCNRFTQDDANITRKGYGPVMVIVFTCFYND